MSRKVILEATNCTKCGQPFEDGVKFPYPEKEILCKKCFLPALKQGCANLNRVLNAGR